MSGGRPWPTSKDGEEVITLQQVRFRQQGDLINVETTTRGIAVEDGGYHWWGELRLWHNEILAGRWVGLSYDGKIGTGRGAMARGEQEATDVIAELKQQEAQQ